MMMKVALLLLALAAPMTSASYDACEAAGEKATKLRKKDCRCEDIQFTQASNKAKWETYVNGCCPGGTCQQAILDLQSDECLCSCPDIQKVITESDTCSLCDQMSDLIATTYQRQGDGICKCLGLDDVNSDVLEECALEIGCKEALFIVENKCSGDYGEPYPLPYGEYNGPWDWDLYGDYDKYGCREYKGVYEPIYEEVKDCLVVEEYAINWADEKYIRHYHDGGENLVYGWGPSYDADYNLCYLDEEYIFASSRCQGEYVEPACKYDEINCDRYINKCEDPDYENWCKGYGEGKCFWKGEGYEDNCQYDAALGASGETTETTVATVSYVLIAIAAALFLASIAFCAIGRRDRKAAAGVDNAQMNMA